MGAACCLGAAYCLGAACLNGKAAGYGRPLYGDQAVISETAVTAAIYYYNQAERRWGRVTRREKKWGSMSLHWTRGRQAPDVSWFLMSRERSAAWRRRNYRSFRSRAGWSIIRGDLVIPAVRNHGGNRKIGAHYSDIAAIGITNQRETTIVWDKETRTGLQRHRVKECCRTADRIEELKKTSLRTGFGRRPADSGCLFLGSRSNGS